MRRVLFILIVCSLSVLTSFALQLGEKYNERRPVVIVCDWDKPPYEFLNDKGEPAGSNIDVMRAVMKELGLPCEFVMKEWSVALKTFERKKADIVLANARRYRNGNYTVSENILNYNRIRVAMFADSVEMVSLKRLEEEGAVFKPGDFSANYFMDGDSINTKYMEFQSPKVALMGLINGDYKYYVWGEEPLRWKIKELNLTGITLNDVGLPISEIHFVGHDKDLIEAIDDQFSRLKQSGEIAQLQDKWLHPERISEKTSPVGIYITLAVIALLVVLYLFSRLAHAHVKRVIRNSTELNEMMFKALHMGNFKIMVYDIAADRMTNRYSDILPEAGISLEEFTARIHPDQQKEFTQKMKRLMEGRDRHFELNKRYNAGTPEKPRWLNFNGHAISELDNDGRPAYVVNAIHDVTQNVEEYKSARQLVRKYDRLSNMPFVAMSFYDKDGWLIDTNDMMKQLCGMTDDSPETKRFWETLCMFDVPLFRGVCSPDDHHDLLFCQHMEYPEFGINNYIECHIRPLFNAKGELANYFISTLNATDDRTRNHLMVMHEREMQKLNEAITQAKQRLSFLLQNTDRYLWRSDLESENIVFYHELGKPEVIMDFDSYLGYMAEEDRLRIRHILTTPQQLNEEFNGMMLHFTHTSQSPDEMWRLVSGTPVRNEEGEVTGHVGVSIDITALMRARQKLEEEKRRADDSLRVKSGFMASMTHELRTPLNAIVGFTGVLEATGVSSERSEYVRIIRNNSDMLQRLINDIIEASATADSPMTIVPEKVDFAAAFDDICLTLEQRMTEPGVQFFKDNPYHNFFTIVDLGRLQQVLTNLVTNAVKFTKEGHISVGYRYEKHGLYLYCEDTGKGIPRNKQEMIFERFVKLDDFVQGTGMGLAICKMIAKSCNGRIGVDSLGENKGSTFWIWIPCERLTA